ncbi:hypothetical protein BABINDRAFT_159520 [Babjeviella inositovora NRRL Y-12698]|uniref:DNA polymerase delta subunit 3 n=1 Tax=Babjeviella inositovora NRRL Y-12698 TaxID=984486 RepID=A0A1E3QZP5_9ASCO|nr:uncharacterized protein BABINDRAFT_159520 [Babjeviella inositovora NRRL Y-12698]ODQ83055.1 hypothetical protein BABINDRAFT_159520 [Babjeviella inositovora NRRL Y-12698]
MELESEKFLSNWLFVNKQSASYRLLSRQLATSVHDAKNLLYSFYEKNKASYTDQLFASYMVSGKLAGPSSTLTIKLYDDANLESIKAEFERIDSVHIYSLAPIADITANLLPDPAVMNAFEYTDEHMKAWGLIKGPEKKLNASRRAPRVPPARVPNRPAVKASTAPESTKVEKVEKAEKPSMFTLAPSRYVSRKVQVAPSPVARPSARAQTEPTRAAYTSRKTEKSERVVIADVEEVEPEDLAPAAPSKRDEQLKELEGMFNDDDDCGWDESSSQKGSLVVIEDTQETRGELVSEPVGAEIDTSLIEVEEPEPAEEIEPVEEPPAVENFMDEDGYLVTRVNTSAKKEKEPSSYASRKSSTSPTKQKASDSSKKRKTTQSSLMNFFGKK